MLKTGSFLCISAMCSDACNSGFINEFKPKYVIAVSYQVVFRFA